MDRPSPAIIGNEALGRPMARNFVWRVGSRVGVTLAQFAAFAVLAHHLEPSRLGIYSFAIVLFTMFRPFSSLGLQALGLREVTQEKVAEGAAIPNIVYLRLLIGAGVYAALAAVVVAGGYRHDEREAALIAGLIVLPVTLQTFEIVLQARLRLGWMNAADVLEATVTLVGTVVLAELGAGLLPFVWLYVAANALNPLVVTVAALRLRRFQWTPRPSMWLPAVRAAAPIGLAGAFIALYYRVDTTILARLKSPFAVGQYGAAYQFLDSLSIVSVLAMSVLNPVLARSFTASRDVLRRRYGRSVHLMSLIAVPIAVGGAMTAVRVVPDLPGFGSYHGAGVSLAILSPAAALILMGTLVSGVVINGDLQRRLLVISAIVLVLNLALNAGLIPAFSYVGASVATVISEAAVLYGLTAVVRRRLGLRWARDRLARVVLAGAVLAVALVPCYLLPPLVQVGVGAVVYLVALFPTRALIWNDLASLLHSDGPRAVVIAGAGAGTAPLEVPGGERVVVFDGLRGAWHALRGVAFCTVRAAGPTDGLGAALAARLAACGHVEVSPWWVKEIETGSRPDGDQRPGRVRIKRRPAVRLADWVWPLLADRVVVGGEAERSALASVMPRLAALGGNG